MPTTSPTVVMTEAELLSNVIELSSVLGWRCAHFRPAVTSHGWRTAVSGDGKGFPDLVLVRDRVLFVELKSARGTLTTDQQDWLFALGVAGAERHIWRPEHWLDGTIEAELRRRS
jgi:hypothetical protein